MAKQLLPTYSICSLNHTTTIQSDLIAERFSDYLAKHTDLYFPHKHSFYHLVYFTKGAGNHSIDFVHYPVQAGQIYFMSPGQVHTWNFKGNVEGYIINFSETYLNSFLYNHHYVEQFSFFSGTVEEQVIQLPANTRALVVQLFESIIIEAGSTNTFKDDLIRAAMVQLFIHVNRCHTKNTAQPNNPYNSVLLHNFKKMIDLHYKDKKLTKEYAALLYVTPNHLNALCKDSAGIPAGELIRNRVILEAKRLLTNASLSIAQIADELNFMDNSYFSKFFKKYTGLTPEIFRKQFDTKK